MSRCHAQFLVGSALLGLLVVGCGLGQQESIWNPSERFITKLEESAVALAKTELVSLNAAEDKYRDKVAEYVMANHPLVAGTSQFFKWYRDYDQFEVRDIFRTESLREPIVIEIAYHFTYMRTPIHTNISLQDGDTPRKDAAAETEYEDSGRFTVVRRYTCDQFGNILTTFEDGASREHFPDPLQPELYEGSVPQIQHTPPSTIQAPPPVQIQPPAGGALPGASAIPPIIP